MKSNASYLGAWLAAVGLAVAFAFAAPNDSSVMGRLPAFMAQTLLRQPVNVPDGLPSDRTLALITFQRGQHAQVESWIEGLNLRNDPSITWVRMPVVNDPGTLTGRSAVENKLLKHYPADTERAKLVPVFTDRASFVRSAGLNSIDQVYAVVVNRQGDVLARVEGQFDANKAQTLRETLKNF
ncbi:hypothetical protein [Polaromonas aquatica]|uniref:hypothetical protein n=1 Tax=Polaromonas aquatica TaxID=332657 RepID=UPI003D6569B8